MPVLDPQHWTWGSVPHHFAEVATLIDNARTDPFAATLSVPPQFGFTTFVGRAFDAYPEFRCLYVSAWHGVAVSDFGRHGRHVTRVHVGGAVPSAAFNLIVIDNITPTMREATDPKWKTRTFDWLASSVLVRRAKDGSVLFAGPRWTKDDLLSQVHPKWTQINIPALNERGESVWPEQRPTEFLKKTREMMSEAEWSALYMGEPLTEPAGETDLDVFESMRGSRARANAAVMSDEG